MINNSSVYLYNRKKAKGAASSLATIDCLLNLFSRTCFHRVRIKITLAILSRGIFLGQLKGENLSWPKKISMRRDRRGFAPGPPFGVEREAWWSGWGLLGSIFVGRWWLGAVVGGILFGANEGENWQFSPSFGKCCIPCSGGRASLFGLGLGTGCLGYI